MIPGGVGILLLDGPLSSTAATASSGGVIQVGQLLLAGGVGAIIVALINAIASHRKLGADAAAVLSRAAADLVQPLSERIAELEKQVERVSSKCRSLERDLDTCRASNARKDAQIAALRTKSSTL